MKPPASIAPAAKAFLEAYKKVAQDAKNGVAAANAGDRKKLLAALHAGNIDSRATLGPAKAIGATGCYIAN